MGIEDHRIALLIDADNSPASRIDKILAEVSTYGVANIRRAYGNWKSAHLNGWEKQLQEYAIRPIQQFDYVKGKNATDMAMSIDAMDLMYSERIDSFGIVSSDADFTPLVMRLLANGHKVYGFGEKKTPDSFVNACSKFLYLEQLGVVENVTQQESSTPIDAPFSKNRNELRMDTRLVRLLRDATQSSIQEDGWSYLGEVVKVIKNQASIDPRNYGYATFRKLITATELFEFDVREEGTAIYMRDIRVHRK
jgi:uncharacterized protein (TIGR00288 family)